MILLTCDICHTGRELERVAHSSCYPLEEREVADLIEIGKNERDSIEEREKREREKPYS